MKKSLLFFITLIITACCYSQEADHYMQQALAALKQHDDTVALYYLNEATVINPSDSGIYALRATLKMNMQDYIGAKADFDTALIYDQRKKYSLYGQRGYCKAALKDYEAAMADYNIAISRYYDPRLDYSRYRYSRGGEEWLDMIWVDSTFEDMGTAANSTNVYIGNVYESRGKAWLGLGRTDSAMEDFARAVDTHYWPGVVDTNDFTAIIKTDSMNCRAWTCRGICKFRLNQRDAAGTDYDCAIDLCPDYGPAYYQRSFMIKLYNEGVIPDAIMASRLMPDDTLVWDRLAVLIANTEGYDSLAIAAYTRFLALHPYYTYIAYYGRAGALMNTGQYKKAIADYDSMLALEPEYKEVLHYRCRAEIALGDTAAARADADKLLQYDSLSEKGRIDLGDILTAEGDHKAAWAAYTWVIVHGSVSGWTQDLCRAYRQRGLLCCKLYRYMDALNDFSSAIKLNFTDLESLLGRAEMNMGFHSYKEALSDINNAMDWHRHDSRPVYARGVLYLRWHKKQLACADFQRAKELGNKDADEMIKKYCK